MGKSITLLARGMDGWGSAVGDGGRVFYISRGRCTATLAFFLLLTCNQPSPYFSDNLSLSSAYS
uniref:Uncharacterized protein n=1 Tax=Oryza punctata TaxID=4537 RepID=A0A0E0MPH6_ORYPU